MLSHRIFIAVLLMLITSSLVGIPFDIIQGDPFIITDDEPLSEWNSNFELHQQITPFIQTYSDAASYQPIDILVKFDSLCWALNESVHSIRICVWDTKKWHELESQIYNLNFSDDSHISSCRVVFLIPSFANGKESYYVYYSKHETISPAYSDHVSVKDAYYYFEPISGLSVEGDYYEISQEDEIIYGIGQKGQVMNRHLSQIAIRMRPGTKSFDILNSDVLASFAFSYQAGNEDEDEIASDQVLIAKDILIDGNLMVQVMVVSETLNGQIRSSNIYTYYFNPSDEKRIGVHVKHEIFEDQMVRGIENGDGRYGAIISYNSKSSSMKKMVFGDILPYLHIYSDDQRIKEYAMIANPEGSTREWLISYEDDCDLGENAWISYSEGINGKTHGIIFSSNENIVSNASEERDGIEIKVAEKEYLDVVGAEVDYASITFGRNAYEPLQPHDLSIQKGLIAEFDAEFVTFQNATFENINDESIFFQTLVKHRDVGSTDLTGDKAIHTLTIIPHLSGRILSYPILRNISGIALPILYAEVYLNETLVASAMVDKPFIGFQLVKIPKLISGLYTIKMYRLIGNDTKRFIGIGQISVQNDTTIHIYCTWEKQFLVNVQTQHDRPLEEVTLQLFQGTLLVAETVTTNLTEYVIVAPFNLFESYVIRDIKNITFQDVFKLAKPYELIGFYKGFRIFNITIPFYERRSDITIDVYDLFVDITDELNLPPDVNVKPFLTSTKMKNVEILEPIYQGFGRYYFSNLPAAVYDLQISYRGYEKIKTIDVPSCGETISIRFAYTSPLSFRLLTVRGEDLSLQDATISIKRDGQVISSKLSQDDSIDLPPGSYVLNVYEKDRLVGSKKIQLSYGTTADIVTIKPSLVALVVTISSILLLGTSLFLFITRKASLNSFLKLIAVGLVLLSLVQPWWVLHAETTDLNTSKQSEMYLYPPTMIEEYSYKEQRFVDIATIPEMFTQFLQLLLYVISAGVGLMVISFIPNIVLRKRFAFVLVSLSIIFVSIVAAAFSLGMEKIAEISLGSLQGTSILEVTLPSEQVLYMNGEWGLGFGFYLIVLASAIAFSAGVYDAVRKHMIKKK